MGSSGLADDGDRCAWVLEGWGYQVCGGVFVEVQAELLGRWALLGYQVGPPGGYSGVPAMSRAAPARPLRLGLSMLSRRPRRSPDVLRERSSHDRQLAEDGEVKAVLSCSVHLSHTTPSPSPSLALGTIHLGKPLPLPLLPGTRVSPAACAASQES